MARIQLLFLIILTGCATTPQGAWQRTDGIQIAEDSALMQKWRDDIAACEAEVDKVDVLSNAPLNRREQAWYSIKTTCMLQRGYRYVKT